VAAGLGEKHRRTEVGDHVGGGADMDREKEQTRWACSVAGETKIRTNRYRGIVRNMRFGGRVNPSKKALTKILAETDGPNHANVSSFIIRYRYRLKSSRPYVVRKQKAHVKTVEVVPC
jgi:hypothetical protein